MKYDSKRYTEFGRYTAALNPFMMPKTRKKLTLEDAAARAFSISEMTAAMIEMISPASQSGLIITDNRQRCISSACCLLFTCGFRF